MDIRLQAVPETFAKMLMLSQMKYGAVTKAQLAKILLFMQRKATEWNQLAMEKHIE